LALFWSGHEVSESARPVLIEGEIHRVRKIESFDTAAIRVTSDRGIKIGVFVTHACTTSREPCIRIECEEGDVVWTKSDGFEVRRPGKPPEHTALEPGPESIFTMGEVLVDALQGEAAAPGCGVRVARAQTLVIAALHQACPIRDVPSRYLSTVGDFIAIADIDRLISEAGSKLKLFSELSVPWSAPGGVWQATEAAPEPLAAHLPPA
jgi:hypothetical protein